jgi:hypothetical protein
MYHSYPNAKTFSFRDAARACAYLRNRGHEDLGWDVCYQAQVFKLKDGRYFLITHTN